MNIFEINMSNSNSLSFLKINRELTIDCKKEIRKKIKLSVMYKKTLECSLQSKINFLFLKNISIKRKSFY
jgi:hypothetical protein